jgi:F0F1-type ATP synthase delta subunit
MEIAERRELTNFLATEERKKERKDKLFQSLKETISFTSITTFVRRWVTNATPHATCCITIWPLS